MKDIQKELGIEVDKSDMSFANIAKAISVVQKKMNIMGTTAKEAEGTLTGSIAMMKASWDNFLAGTGDLGKVVDSARLVFDNILRIVNDAMPDIVENIIDWLPELFQVGTDILGQIAQRNNGEFANFNEYGWRNTNEYCNCDNG